MLRVVSQGSTTFSIIQYIYKKTIPSNNTFPWWTLVYKITNRAFQECSLPQVKRPVLPLIPGASRRQLINLISEAAVLPCI